MSGLKRVTVGGQDVRVEDRQNVIRKEVRSRWRLVLGQWIGPADCPLMRRWFAETPWGSIRLHHFLRPDDDRHLHDHPFSFLTVVLKGGYRDVTSCPHPRCLGGKLLPLLPHYGDNAAYPPVSDEPPPICPTCRGGGKLVDELRVGSVRWRPAEHKHAVETDGCWTFVVTGPERRLWGFWVSGAFQPMADYFRRYGYAPCEP